VNPKNVKVLREWDGDINSMSRIKLVRVIDPNESLDSMVKQAKSLGKEGHG